MNTNPSIKKKISFNIIDVILIAVFLAAILTLVYFFKEKVMVVSNGEKTEEIVYKLEISPMNEQFKGLVEIGDTVYHTETLKSIGQITDVSYSECYYNGVDKSTGKPIKTAYPGMITMTLTVKVSAEINETGYFINGKQICYGDTVPFRVPSFTASAKTVYIETLSDKEIKK